MSDRQPPITAEAIAGLIQRMYNADMSPTAPTASIPRGASFDLTTPATGQCFRVTVMEIAAEHVTCTGHGWDDDEPEGAAT